MADSPPPSSGPAAVLNQLKSLWGKQSPKRRVGAIAVVGVIAAVIAATTLMKHETTWTAVAEGASPDDAQELLATLESKNLPVRLTAGKVEVPSDRIDEARAAAAAAGLPRTGKGFELFDGASLGQSSFAEQVNYRRALEGELARSIAALAQVQGARVHLALGKQSVFKDQEEPPSASIALRLHPGQTLSDEQVHGVRELVAASVEGMKAGSVVIVDNHGNLLDAGEPSSSDKRASIENTLTLRIRTMLERVVGVGKVSVVTTAVVDESKESVTEDKYDADHPALRSESRTVEGTGANSAIAAVNSGVASTTGPLQGNATTPNGNAGDRMQETKNYEVSHVVRQTTKPEAQLEQLHVAIVVDYKTDKDGKPIARTKEELDELTALARQAAGIDDARGDKIEVRSIAFAAEPDSGDKVAAPVAPKSVLAKIPVIPVAAGAGGLVLIGVILMVLKSKKKQKQTSTALVKNVNFALPVPVAELEKALEAKANAPALATSDAPALPVGKPVRERVLEVVRGDVERTAEVLTAWLSEMPATPAMPAAKGAK